MEGKSNGKTFVTAQIEFRAPTLQTESWTPHWPSADVESEKSQVGDETSSYPSTEWRKKEFYCLGWVELDQAGDEINQRECWQRVRGGESGFCEILNTTSGEIFRVMQTTHLSLKNEVRFTCELAKEFTNFRHLARTYRHDPPLALDQNDESSTNGIAMAVYERVLPSAYASVRLLRFKGCRLPIELWFRHNELSSDNPVLQELVRAFGPIQLRTIYDERIESFFVKAHALYYSHFSNVLVLDADNFVTRDPTFLFSSTAFTKLGAVFWPDFWHPANTIFNIHAQSLIWELLDLKYVDMMEQESGQVLVNRVLCRSSIERLMFFATHKPNLMGKLQLAWGDKDLFRLAWLSVRQPFYFNDHRLPGSIGIVHQERQRFCGLSMAQYDLGGKTILFLHRNTVKLTGRMEHEKKIWHTLQEFPLQSEVNSEALPVIESFSGEQLFDEMSCFGVKRYRTASEIQMSRVSDSQHLAAIESLILAFARQAHNLLYPSSNSTVD